MKISVLVKPNSKVESVEEAGERSYVVRVRAIPAENRANERTRELLAETLNVPKSSIELVSGHKSRKKVFQIG
jgi:uncharacterized protein YggU (UPF0235/DUF167 family)